MFHEVSLQPRQRHFELREGESILAAGLRAGLRLRYGCSNGNCGECQARLVRGDTQRIQHSDYAFSAAERTQGFLLMCSHTACSDIELEVREIGGVDDIAPQQLRAKISRIERLGDDYAVVHLRTPRSQLLQFLAGQDVWVDFGVAPARRLALANCPCDGMRPQLHLHRRDDAFSRFVFEQARVGGTCELRGPLGDFVLGDVAAGPLLFIAYDTGFAAINSLLEQVIALDWNDPLALVWLAAREQGLYRSNYCRSLRDALDDFTVLQAACGQSQSDFGIVLADALDKLDSSADWRAFAVVPAAQTEHCRELLLARGVREDHIKLQALLDE